MWKRLRKSKSQPPLTLISVDVDPIDRHLQGYGVTDAAPCPLVYERAMPRLVDVAKDAGVKLTFFCLGRDANAHRHTLRETVGAGHEIANHSFNHPQPFGSLDPTALEFEIGASRATLTAACGEAVVGFRSPAWDVSEKVIAYVATTGHTYDASLFPSAAVMANRLAVALKSGGDWRRVLKMGGWSQARATRTPHRLKINGVDALWEVPMAVSPIVRAPYYHTLSYLLPPAAFDAIGRSVRVGGAPVSYVLHAVDALGMNEDSVHPAMARHPGMDWSLDRKLEALTQLFRRFASQSEAPTLRAQYG